MNPPKQEPGQHAVHIPIRPSPRHAHQALVRPTQAELDAPCARWSRVLPNGSYELDGGKLRCLLSRDERDDRLLVRNVIHGTILSARVYPLIFDEEGTADEPMVRLRSLGFFRRLLADKERGVEMYAGLSDEEKVIVAVGVRDLYLASERGLSSEEEIGLLRGMMGMLDETVGCIEAMGMNISFHPSGNFTAMKLLDLDLVDEEGLLGPDWSPLFAQVMEATRLVVAFVDPVELSYHNMENIVPLDRWVECKLRPGRDGGEGELLASLGDARQIQAGREVWTCKLQGATTCDLLKQLSALNDLYTAPPNKVSRGGERFIFHSALLSKTLTEAVRNSDLLHDLAQGQLASSFEFVNYVFRCNRFAAGDAMFANHHDTPYYDKQHGHVSKYTFLIYLTTGRGDPILHVDGVDLRVIDEEMTCVIFDQSYEHEGKPFLDSEKVFVRSELVFKDMEMEHNSIISSLFSEACYMTRESLLNEDLNSYAQDCFERANSLHWAAEREASLPAVYLLKEFHGIQFLTNGYNYWFPKSRSIESPSSSSSPNEIDCAVVAVLDFFNCKVDGKPFNALCDPSVTVRGRFETIKDVWEYLLRVKTDVRAAPLRRLEEVDVEALISRGPDGKGLDVFEEDYETSDEKDERDQEDDEEDEVDEVEDEEEEDDEDDEEEEAGETSYFTCCPDCHYESDTFDAWKSPLVRRSYRKSWQFTRAALHKVPLLIFNEELVINESSIKVDGDKIFFLRGPHDEPRPRVNFAGCWDGPYGSVPQYMRTSQEIGAMNLQLPPILWHEFDEGYQFVLDLFRNDWMVAPPRELKIPVPVVTNEPIDKKTKGKQMYIKRLCRVYRSGEFRPLFDTLRPALDSCSESFLERCEWCSSSEEEDEDGDEDERGGV